MTDPLYDKGLKVRRAVLGDRHVDRAEATKTALDADFQHYITEMAWGGVWGRNGLTRRERSMLTIAMLASLGHHEELAMHIRATPNTGVSLEDVREVLMQVTVYAGVPAGNAAFKVAKETFADMGMSPLKLSGESQS